jgi:DNA polymerase type B, organellar and viral
MDNSVKYGYKFNILWDYTFYKGYPFKNFIGDLYQLRLNYPKNDPLNYTAKLKMNNFFGKFAMDDNFNSIEIVFNNSFQNYINKFNL